MINRIRHAAVVARARGTLWPVVLLTGYAAGIVTLYRETDGQWISLPWDLLGMLALTLAISAGFRGLRGQRRTAGAQGLWAAVTLASRDWMLACRSSIDRAADAQRLMARHLAWLITLRHQMQHPQSFRRDDARPLEASLTLPAIDEAAVLKRALAEHVDSHERHRILLADHPSRDVLHQQGEALKRLLAADLLAPATFLQLYRMLHELQRLQAAVERLPGDADTDARATVDHVLLLVFVVLLPFGLLDAMGPLVLFDDVLVGALACWSIVPLTVLLGWVYLLLVRAERTDGEGPGGDAGYAWMSAACGALERELRVTLGERVVGVPAEVRVAG